MNFTIIFQTIMKFLPKLVKHFPWIIIICLAIYIFIQRHTFTSKIHTLFDTINNLRTTVEETENIISKLNTKVDKSREIERFLNRKLTTVKDSVNNYWQDKTSELLSIIKEKDEKIKGSMTAVLKWKEKSDSLKDVVQTKVGLRYKVDFTGSYNGVFVKGYTLTNPPYAWLSWSRKPLILNLTVTEDKNKYHKAYLTLNDTTITVDEFNFKFVSFEEKIGIWRYIRDMPWMVFGVDDNETYLSCGLQIWRFRPFIYASNKGLGKGFEFTILR